MRRGASPCSSWVVASWGRGHLRHSLRRGGVCGMAVMNLECALSSLRRLRAAQSQCHRETSVEPISQGAGLGEAPRSVKAMCCRSV